MVIGRRAWKLVHSSTKAALTFLVAAPLFLLQPRYLKPSISSSSVGFSTIYSSNRSSNNHSSISKTSSNHDNNSNNSNSSAVEWLHIPEFEHYPDSFSDSWLMNKETFLMTNLSAIDHVEGACFEAFAGRLQNLRMPLDWLDFSVEHMSKWWRVLHVPTYDYALERVLSIFESYRVERLAATKRYPRQFLRPTVALIAFQQYKREDNSFFNESRRLTISSLAATIASLVQAGMGRIIVVGYEADDEAVALDTFRVVGASACDRHFSLLGSDLAYARVTPDMVASDFDPVNLPKASLIGLRRAMVGNDANWTQAWLGGDPLQWKYVYLTEPDTILNTRPSALRSLEEALQDGLILAPHRLQPIPFEDDVPNSTILDSFVRADFKTPIQLDSLAGDVCCDEQAGSYRPGSHGDTKDHCGNFWWLCGFPGYAEKKYSNNHTRLYLYDFIRLAQGTGVVNLAGTEHGRRCLPRKHGSCERRMSPNHPDHPANQ